MFKPTYQLNNILLNNIVKIKNLVSKMNDQKFSERAHSTQILDFKRLVEKNIITRHNKGKATYYTLVKDS